MRPHNLGFTLVETTIALAVAGVLLGIALPAFNGTMSAVRSADARNSLLTSLMTASGKAAVSGSVVSG